MKFFNRSIPNAAHDRMGELAAAGHTVSAVALTSDGGWAVLGAGAEPSHDFSDKLAHYVDVAEAPVTCVAVSAGSSFFICAADGVTSSGSTPMRAAIGSLEAGSASVRWAAFDGDGWVLVADDGSFEAHNIDDNCFQAMRNISQSAPIDVVAFDGAGGWIVVARQFVASEGISAECLEQIESEFIANGHAIDGIVFGASADSWSVYSSHALVEADADPLRVTESEQAIRATMATLGLPGMTVAIVDGGEVIRTAGYGWLAKDGSQAAHPESVFQAGSVSKLVNCLGVLRAVDSGLLGLDDDAELLLAMPLPRDSPWPTKQVTVRGLLRHSAGINVHGFGGYTSGATLPTVEQMIAGASPAGNAALRVFKEPDTEYDYSGGGSTLLQHVIEQVTAEDYATWMKSNVLIPLGMWSSTFEIGPPSDAIPPEGVAEGHENGVRITGGRNSFPQSAAAGLYTTAVDLCQVIKVINGNGSLDGASFVSSALIDDMLTPSPIQGIGDAGNPFDVGLGCNLQQRRGNRVWNHGGSNKGFTAKIYGIPNLGAGFVIMENGKQGDFRVDIESAIRTEYDW